MERISADVRRLFQDVLAGIDDEASGLNVKAVHNCLDLGAVSTAFDLVLAACKKNGITLCGKSWPALVRLANLLRKPGAEWLPLQPKFQRSAEEMRWDFIGSSWDGKAFLIDGVNVWKYKWKQAQLESAHVLDLD